MWPGLTVSILGTSIGIGMLVLGMTHIVIYFTRDHMESVLHMDLTYGVVFAAFGAFMLFHSDFVEIALPFAVGVLLLIGAMIKLQYAVDMKRMDMSRWKILLVFVIIMAIMGLLLIYNPFSMQVLVYYIAVSLILEGLLNILSILLISHRVKQIQRGLVPYNQETPHEAPASDPFEPEQDKTSRFHFPVRKKD